MDFQVEVDIFKAILEYTNNNIIIIVDLVCLIYPLGDIYDNPIFKTNKLLLLDKKFIT